MYYNYISIIFNYIIIIIIYIKISIIHIIMIISIIINNNHNQNEIKSSKFQTCMAWFLLKH